MRVDIVPLLKDNYAYLVVDEATRRAVVVDPSEAGGVLRACEARGLTIEAIWCTHHHPDHVGGVVELVAHAGVEVIASAYDRDKARIQGQTQAVREGDTVSFAGKAGRVLEVPGHTLGAIAYVFDGALFSGDTLFLAGCGRLFEGTAKQMRASLERLAALPAATHVYPGHEYTVKNLEFAATVEPDNGDIQRRLERVRQTREDGLASVPGTLAEELVTNPFLRSNERGVRVFAAAADPDEVFAHVRAAKDKF